MIPNIQLAAVLLPLLLGTGSAMFDGSEVVVPKSDSTGAADGALGGSEYAETRTISNGLGTVHVQAYRDSTGAEEIRFLFDINDPSQNAGDEIRVYFDFDHSHSSTAVDRGIRIRRTGTVTITTVNLFGDPTDLITLGGSTCDATALWCVQDNPGDWVAEVRIPADSLGRNEIPNLSGMHVRVLNLGPSTSTGNFPDVSVATIASWTNLKTRYPIDYLVVLDHSGSMLSQDKWINAKAATNFFVNTMAILGDQAHFEDRVGLALFKWGCSGENETVVTKPLAPVGSFPVGSYTDAPPAPPDPLSNSCTPIGEGLATAFATLNATNDDDVELRQRAVLLLSDGLQNRPESSLSPADTGYDPCPGTPDEWDPCPAGSSNVGVSTVAFGEGDWQVDGDLMSWIAGRYNGAFDEEYQFTSPNPEELKESFIIGLEGPYNTNMLYSGVPANFTVESGMDKLIAIASWSGAGVEDIKLQRDPGTGFVDVPCDPPAASNAVGFAMCAVPTPDAGTWRIQPADDTFNTPPSRVFVVVDLRLRAQFAVTPRQPGTGEAVLLTARLRDGGRPVLNDVTHPVQVSVQIQTPEQGVGTFASTHSPQTCAVVQPTLPRPDPQVRPGAALAVVTPSVAGQSTGDPQPSLFTLMTQLLQVCNLSGLGRAFETAELRDDGTQGDEVANDGVYSGRYADTDIEGTYNFRFNVDGTNAQSESFMRTRQLATFVRVKVDADASPSGSNIVQQTGNNVIREFFILPRSSGGEYYGPFKPQYVDFIKVSGPGSFIGAVIDYGNGYYARRIQYDRTQGEPVVVPTVYGDEVGSVGGLAGRLEIGVHGSLTLFDDAFEFDDGFGVGAHIGVRLANSLVAEVEGDATFVDADIAGVGVDGRVFTLFGNLRYDFGSSDFVPFVKAGAGRVWFRDFGIDDDAVAYQAAAGASYWLSSSFGLRAQVRAMRFDDVFGAGATTNYRGTAGVVFRF